MDEDWDEGLDETTSFCLPDKMENGTPGAPLESFVVKRHLYTQATLDDTYKDQSKPLSACDVIKRVCRVSPGCVGRRALDCLPIARTLRGYKWRQWILPDIISGLSVGFIHLPQGLGFGLLASLQPVHGLYTTFFPILVYLLFGTSPHISMGSNALIALLTAALVDREADHFRSTLGANETVSDEEIMAYKVGVASAMCFIGGLILLGMGILRLGFLTSFMSKSFIGGFTFSAAVHITTSQIVKMLHLKLPGRSGFGKLVMTYVDIFTNIRDVNPADVVVGLICMAVLLAVKLGINERFKDRMKFPVPIELIVVVLSTLISHYAELSDRFGIAVVGGVPAGMPAPSLPRLDGLSRVVTDSFVTAILIFALTISLGKLTARIHGNAIDDNQELVAYGLCQLVGSFFMNFPSCTAPPRTMMLSSLGSKSTLSGFTSAVFILLILLVAGQLFVSLPIAMLAAMIIVAMKDLLLQIRNLKSLSHVNKPDLCIWLLTAAFGVFGTLDIGLLVGVLASMVAVLVVSQLAKGTLLGKADDEDLILDLKRTGVSPVPGVKIFRFESALYFASQERFKKQLYALVENPTTSPLKDVTLKDIQAPPPITTDNKDSPVQIISFTPSSLKTCDCNCVPCPHSTPSLPLSASAASPQVANSADSNAAARSNSSHGVPDLEPKKEEEGSSGRVSHLILDCSAMTYVDVSGVDMLQLVMTQFERAGVEVCLASVPSATLATLCRAGFDKKMGMDKVFYSVHDALQSWRLGRGGGEGKNDSGV